jgi:pimeloyl-ACP methyl ester carboxylesterase
MKTVTSKDGTTIAFDQYGTGPTVILVGGALQHRAGDPGTAKLAALLAPHFTVIHYDRRGRGDSTDTQPYAVEREIEDLDALIDAAGGMAYLFGMSSGGALVLEAALKLGDKIKKIAIYEVPYNAEETARKGWVAYRKQLDEALAAGRKSDAAALFMKLVGMPDDQLAGFRQSPAWGMFEGVAPTLAYDAAVVGDEADVPIEKAARVIAPALVMAGSATYPFMLTTAKTLANTMPHAQYRTLEGQTHEVNPEVLAPVLDEFFVSTVSVK